MKARAFPPGRASGGSPLPRAAGAICLLLLLAGAAFQVTPDQDYTAAFHRTEGWAGADGAYSLGLGDGRILWLFGDTLVGPVLPDGSRGEQTWMARNSVALQPGPEPRDLVFFQDVFRAREPEEWYWPYHGTCTGPGRAQVFLGRFRVVRPGDPFGFEQVGLDLADLRVEVGRPPRVDRIRPVPWYGATGGATTSWGNAVAHEGPWMLVYGVVDSGADKRLVLARAPRTHVADFSTWRFFAGPGWARRPEQACVLATGVSNELSVHRDGAGGWLMVSGPPDLSSTVLLRRSPAPQGPWSAPETILQAPEARDGIFAYNAKAHPDLSDERGLLVSYNVNAMDPDRIMRDASLYRPRFVRLR